MLFFGGSDFSSENKGSSSLSDASCKALVEPVGAEAVQRASELLQITGAPRRSTRRLPRLQYSGPPTEHIKRSNSCIALNGSLDHKSRDANDRPSEPTATKLTERIESLTSLDRLQHRSKQITSNKHETSQFETPFRWSNLARHTWNCWYGENVTSTTAPLQRSYTNISFKNKNTSIGKLLCSKDDGIHHLESSDDKVKHKSDEQNISSILPISESPLLKVSLKSQHRSMGTMRTSDEQYENTKHVNLNYLKLLENIIFPDPLTAPPPFVRSRLTQMGVLVANSVYNEAFQRTHFRKKVKKIYKQSFEK